MSAFERAALRPILPEERILRCSATRGVPKRKGYKPQIICEKPALHWIGCLLSPSQLEAASGSDAAYSLVRVIQDEARRHTGRNSVGRWFSWMEGE